MPPISNSQIKAVILYLLVMPRSLCRANENPFHEVHTFEVISQFGRLSPNFLEALTIAAKDVDSIPDYAGPVSPDVHVESRNQKLADVLIEQKVHDMNIKPHLKHALIGVIDRFIDAFAANHDALDGFGNHGPGGGVDKAAHLCCSFGKGANCAIGKEDRSCQSAGHGREGWERSNWEY